jgi:hypothetical protein
MAINRPPIYDYGSGSVPFDYNPKPAVGVPLPPTPTVQTSGTGSSPGTGTNSSPRSLGAPSPRRIKNFDIKAKLLRPALTSHFECWFNPPNPIRAITNYNDDLFSLSCSEASLPGSSILTNEINDDYTGVTERLGYRRQYDNTTDFTFYVDASTVNGGYNVIMFFEEWMRYAMGETSYAPDHNYNYRVRYPDEESTKYRTEIFLNKFERDFNGNYLQYVFVAAYPSNVNSMPVSYDSSQLLKCTVSFTFNRYILRRGGYAPEVEPQQIPATGIPRPNSPVINDVNGNTFPLGPGIPGLTGDLFPDIA